MMKAIFILIAAISIFSINMNVNAQDPGEGTSGERDYIVLFNNAEVSRIGIELAKDLLRNNLEANSFTYRTSPRTSPITFTKTFEGPVSGVVVSLVEREAEAIAELGYVELVEPDSLAYANSNWGLDRMNQVNLPLDSNDARTYTGQGADIYIIDTGINQYHTEFSGRVGNVVSMVSGGTADCHGHGTHVASLAAGETFGVASDATVHSVRISNVCTGNGPANASDIVAAFNWVANNAEPNSVVNYSYSSGSSSIRTVMDNVVSSGHVIVTSAGNDNSSACSANTYKPTRALIVGSTQSNDARAPDSNYDSCISLFAPGHGILGATHSNNTGSITFYGTSMASPFVAGIAATYRARFPNADAYEVMEAVIDDATTGVVSGTNGSPNRLAYTEIDPPSAYWQITNVTQTTVNYGGYPRPGCNSNDVQLVSKPGPWGRYITMTYECKP